VRVLSRLFRGKFLAFLREAHEQGKLSFFGNCAPLEEPSAFQRFAKRFEKIRMGGLFQASLWRASAGFEISVPLHAPRRHLELAAHLAQRRPSELPLAELPE